MPDDAGGAVHSAPRGRLWLQMTGASREQWTAWLALVVMVGAVVLLYLSASLAVSRDPLLMPLDDTYIHFQYARQWAAGQPMTYYPGDPPTSGATSLLYPPLLALGYAAGFSGWSLAYWALGIGALAFFGSAWLVYLIGRASPLAEEPGGAGYALALALAYGVTGPFVWAALSGMETALFLFLTLLTFYAAQGDHPRLAVAAGTLAVLARPEGVIVAALAVLALAVRRRWPGGRGARLRRGALLALPVAAAFVQPALNWAATGSASASGMQAKSLLANTAAPLSERLADVASFFGRMWGELLVGRSADFGTFTSPLLAPAALGALLAGTWLAWRQRRANAAVLALATILALTAAVATLDTAFWQFKRYQLPAIALLYPAAAWAARGLGDGLAARAGWRAWRWALPALVLVSSALTALSFARYYDENVAVVRDQQVPMARWVRDNLPEEENDPRIGVHDVGMMGYFSERPLYDVVGLTLPGPAPSWRQGPGAIYEHMAHSRYRPGAFAIYPDVQGLRYLLDAGVFGAVLAEFPVELGEHNVAAAAEYQAVYAADWTTTRPEEIAAQASTLDAVQGLALVDAVDVAYLSSEAEHGYTWWQDQSPPGFVTEVYTHWYHACGLPDQSACRATDGGRVLTGGEAFTVHTRPGEDLLLVTRVHGRTSVPLAIFVDGVRVAERVQPAVPGRWVEIVTWVPAAQITGTRTRVRIEADVYDSRADAYSPYYHWAYQGAFSPDVASDGQPVAVFGDDGAVRLREVTLHYTPLADGAGGQVAVRAVWQGPAPGAGDGVIFVHLYNSERVDTEPVAQVVTRPGGGALPPANWLPGTLTDTYTVMLPEDLPPGTYVVALGMFEARTGVRYPVTGAGAGPDRRLFIGEIVVEETAQ
ncbi:MAG: hypothetical protein AB1435_10685 [Chloroflexota bacterium]